MKEIFKEAENTSAFLKCGIQGFAGSGKTFTACQIAIGLHNYIKSKKPIYFIDTETGADFLMPKFVEAKIKLFTSKTRAFSDLCLAVDEAEKNGSILIIDSITHFWNEVMQAFQDKMGVKRLLFHHWMPIKAEWRVFTDKFINSNLHIIMCGRAGYEYEYEKDEEGTNELVKTGTKLKAEGEMGYEPSLMLEMEKVKTDKRIGASWLNRCWVLKDRFDIINSKCFDNPKFDDFLPHIELLNLGGKHIGVDASRNSKDLFERNDSASNIWKRKQILIEELTDELDLRFDTRSKLGKETRINTLKTHFGTSSRKAIEELNILILEKGLEEIKKIKIEEVKTKKEEE